MAAASGVASAGDCGRRALAVRAVSIIFYLWLTDCGILPRRGAANPALSLTALMTRAADVIVGAGRADS